jgi:hypothetical protein
LLPPGAEDQVPVENLTGSPALIAQIPAPIRDAVVAAFANSITAAFLVAVPFALLALVLVVLTPELPLRDTLTDASPEPRSEGDAIGSPLPEVGA